MLSVGSEAHPPTSSLGEGRSWLRTCAARYLTADIYYHHRASPKLASNLLIFTKLNLFEVELGVTHDSCTSGTATSAV
ncbi:MAG: hypothetical protein PUE90_02415, partial [Bacteroidales bacterium]|nr:hypothetical protein [Bacteroidales bacterium]